MRFNELSLTAQTAYAQLFDATLASELSRSVASLRGSFAKKTVKGRDYWYFQFTDLGGTLRQFYVGPDSDLLRPLVAESKKAKDQPLLPLARSALALGCTPVLARHFRVIRRLSEYGFFRSGGVLVGTHAFLAYGNLFGVRWGEASRTQDVDLAHAAQQRVDVVALLQHLALHVVDRVLAAEHEDEEQLGEELGDLDDALGPHAGLAGQLRDRREAGSTAELDFVRSILAYQTGVQPDQVSDLAVSTMAPLLRGTQVNLR